MASISPIFRYVNKFLSKNNKIILFKGNDKTKTSYCFMP
ncbi:hypothetical protein CHK_0502 [Christensenella hongkongensis]|uniref:Uncharacterized protein n=1 Tax=Christensenella hongkongensis TaxID=270498 RepID=A0A0M2NP64_9FIRM|nr:hypothetical protein CHK_0502 [Christensenella hongkongensis]